MLKVKSCIKDTPYGFLSNFKIEQNRSFVKTEVKTCAVYVLLLLKMDTFLFFLILFPKTFFQCNISFDILESFQVPNHMLLRAVSVLLVKDKAGEADTVNVFYLQKFCLSDQ